MLTMTQKNDIRKMYFEEGVNISNIARITKHDRKTIREYINKDDWNDEMPHINPESSFPKLNPYKKVIDEWLHEDIKARAKQRHTAKRVYDRLCNIYGQEFNCSYRTVAKYVACKKKELFKKNDCCLPLEHFPGEAQADFGKADFYENGTLYSGSYLNISFPYSNAGFMQIFKGENTECLLEGLKTIFKHIGVIPYRIWFDNTGIIVKHIMKEGKRELTDDFLRFKQHYAFDAVFCNPSAGHEKGSVENKVGYHRRNLLVPVPRFERLEEFNKELLDKCDKDMDRDHYRKNATIRELFSEDVKKMVNLPRVEYDVCKYITVKTDACARFYLNNGNYEYSTAPKYANSRILVKMTAYNVIPLDENYREIIKHRRLYGDSKQQSMEWLPYLTQLARKPNALKYTGIYDMLPDPLKEYLDCCSRSERGRFLMTIANMTETDGFENTVNTVSKALSYNANDLDSLMAIHNRLTNIIPEFKPVKLPEDIPELKKNSSNISNYDKLLARAGGHK